MNVLDLMDNLQHLCVCMCVDRWSLRGYHRLSGSHKRPQGFEGKIIYYYLLVIPSSSFCVSDAHLYIYDCYRISAVNLTDNTQSTNNSRANSYF